ncbi:MAG TPA: YceI family protein [Verrucomicrobiae bacterium]|nr:YceI family protein [Verrucomicrobiae bacterium]
MMRASKWLAGLAGIIGVVGVAALWTVRAAPPQAQAAAATEKEITLKIDAANSKVHYTVDSTLHTVHGTFTLKDGSMVHFDPATGKAGGEVAVYATSGESGNSSRDERMHKEILQTGKYPDFIFRPNQVEGRVSPGGSSDVKLHGVMMIHGGEHEMVAVVHAELSGDQWKGTAKFDVPYIQWGIKDPSNWVLKVKPLVNVEVDMRGAEKQEK